MTKEATILPKQTARKVTTLDDTGFDKACAELQNIVEASGFKPDYIVGIRTGGAVVAERMFPALPHIDVASRRPSTKAKRSVAGRVLRGVLLLTPRALRDRLRIMEAERLERQYDRLRAEDQADPDAGLLRKKIGRRSDRIEWPRLPEGSNVLIVDDAVDSGVTLAAVVSSLRKRSEMMSPDRPLCIRTAVITSTFAHPLTESDFTLYNDRRLIRFPWSIDR